MHAEREDTTERPTTVRHKLKPRSIVPTSRLINSTKAKNDSSRSLAKSCDELECGLRSKSQCMQLWKNGKKSRAMCMRLRENATCRIPLALIHEEPTSKPDET